MCRLYKPHVGGVEKHVEEISKILSADNSIQIITEQSDSTLPIHQNYPESEVFRIPIGSVGEKHKKWVIWKWVWKNRRLFYQVDLIHIHDVFFWLLPILLLITKPKLYVTFHGYEGDNPPGLKAILWHKIAEWITWGNICIGNFHRKWYHTNPTIVSFGAVSLPATSKFKSNSKKAIYIGRLAKDTGIIEYLKAAKALKLEVDIFGDGPLRTEVAEYISTHHLKARLHGLVPGASAKLPNYQIAFVSRYLTILEALVYRIPVIAQYNNSIKYDYLSDSPFRGFISIVSDSKQIIDAYRQISKIKLQSGYNWVRNQTWQKMAQNYLRLWS